LAQKAVGHMLPSSRVAVSLKPKVAYLAPTLGALWKKQMTFFVNPRFELMEISFLLRKGHSGVHRFRCVLNVGSIIIDKPRRLVELDELDGWD